MNRGPIIVVLALVLVPIAGCRALRTDCRKPGPYASAQSIPPLRIPPGLEAPNTRAAVRIPELAEPERPRGADEPCLDAPPSYKTRRDAAPPQA